MSVVFKLPRKKHRGAENAAPIVISKGNNVVKMATLNYREVPLSLLINCYFSCVVR